MIPNDKKAEIIRWLVKDGIAPDHAETLVTRHVDKILRALAVAQFPHWIATQIIAWELESP